MNNVFSFSFFVINDINDLNFKFDMVMNSICFVKLKIGNVFGLIKNVKCLLRKVRLVLMDSKKLV